MTDQLTPAPDVDSDDAAEDEIETGPTMDYVGEGARGDPPIVQSLTGATSVTSGTPISTSVPPSQVTMGGSSMSNVPPIKPPVTPASTPWPSFGAASAASIADSVEGASMKLLGREPTLWIGVVSSLLVVLGTAGFHWLTGQEAALWVVAINAIAGAANAYLVRPISPVAFTYAVGSIVAVAGAYGLNLPIETVAAINAAVIPILALLTRDQVSPVASAVTSA